MKLSEQEINDLAERQYGIWWFLNQKPGNYPHAEDLWKAEDSAIRFLQNIYDGRRGRGDSVSLKLASVARSVLKRMLRPDKAAVLPVNLPETLYLAVAAESVADTRTLPDDLLSDDGVLDADISVVAGGFITDPYILETGLRDRDEFSYVRQRVQNERYPVAVYRVAKLLGLRSEYAVRALCQAVRNGGATTVEAVATGYAPDEEAAVKGAVAEELVTTGLATVEGDGTVYDKVMISPAWRNGGGGKPSFVRGDVEALLLHMTKAFPGQTLDALGRTDAESLLRLYRSEKGRAAVERYLLTDYRWLVGHEDGVEADPEFGPLRAAAVPAIGRSRYASLRARQRMSLSGEKE